jgi:hypothetical protein
LSDIFREIDEELRRENWAKLWERYSVYVIAFAVVIVLATAGIVYWREQQLRDRRAEGLRYMAALDLARTGQDDKASDAFAAIAREGGTGHAVLARFEDAAMRARLDDDAGALQRYDAIAADGGVDQVYRDLATLLGAMHRLDSDPKAAADRVQPLTAAQNPWRPSALEVTALAKLKSGDAATARKAYQDLSDDLEAPQAIRQRAAEMVAALAP